MRLEIENLSNGLACVAAPIAGRESVSIGFWVKVGSRNETPVENGVSHFLEHMLFKGTAKRSTRQIKEEVEGVGGSLNAFTSEECTAYFAKCHKRNFENVFDVLSDMMLNATIPPTEVEKERTVILEEIKMTDDQPGQLVDEHLTQTLWPNHALGRPIAGTLKSVNSLKREVIAGYRDHYYQPSSMVVCATGAVTPNLVRRLSKKYFDSRAAKDAKPFDRYATSQEEPRIHLMDKGSAETHLAMGCRALERNHPDEVVMDLLSVLMGGNMSSRLFNEVREERGLAYEIGSHARKFHEVGAFEISAGVDRKKITQCFDVVLKELRKIKTELVGNEELRRAKDYYLGQMELGLESSMSQMFWYGESALLLGRLRSPKDIAKRIEKIRPADLRRVAKEIFKAERLNLAVVGPDVETLRSELLTASEHLS